MEQQLDFTHRDDRPAALVIALAGVFCLHAWFFHGESFCTGVTPNGRRLMAFEGGWSKLETDLDSSWLRRQHTSTRSLLETSPTTLEKKTSFGPDFARTVPANITKAETTTGKIQMKADTNSEGESAADKHESKHVPYLALKRHERLYVGPNSRVVEWVKWSGIISMVWFLCFLIKEAQSTPAGEMSWADHLLNVAGSGYIIMHWLGSYVAYSGVVPLDCREGDMGDHYCFQVLWWICTVWNFALALSLVLCCCAICCWIALLGLSSARRDEGGPDRGEYANVGEAPAPKASEEGKDPYDPTDPNNTYV